MYIYIYTYICTIFFKSYRKYIALPVTSTLYQVNIKFICMFTFSHNIAQAVMLEKLR